MAIDFFVKAVLPLRMVLIYCRRNVLLQGECATADFFLSSVIEIRSRLVELEQKGIYPT